MVCVFLWTRAAEAAAGGAWTSEVLVARDRDALGAHLDTLIEEEHPMAMLFEEAEPLVSWTKEDPDFGCWYGRKGNEFRLENFHNVPVSSDGRAWVTLKSSRSDKYPGFLLVATDKRPETDGNSEVLEVFILGTQLSKSASKT
jgi:hypothetical protein